MPYNVAAILGEIDGVLSTYEAQYNKHRAYDQETGDFTFKGPTDVSVELATLLHHTIERLAPAKDYMEAALSPYPWLRSANQLEVMAGVLRALRQQYASGAVLSVQERIRSNVFSDFLEMAEYLIEDEGLKDPATVLAGGVLE